MAASTEFVQLDVEGDGNCFYRAVYGAAKYHPMNILDRFLLCLDLPTGIDEDEFCLAIREKLAAEIRGDLFEHMHEVMGSNLYESMREAAHLAVNGVPLLWAEIIDSASEEFQKRFAEPDEFLEMSMPQFKRRFARIISDSGVYASEMDYKILEFLLAQCGFDLLSVRPTRGDNPDLIVERDGRPVLLVRRLATREHYSYLLPKEVYEAHKAELRKWRKVMAIFKVNSAASAPKTRKGNGTTKVRNTRRKKPANSAAKSNSNTNNANLAAAIAASMANASKRHSRL